MLLAALHRSASYPAGALLLQVEVAAAHRGRLSLLVNLLGKPLGALCTEMEGKQSDFRVGDVKYHLGQSGTVRVGPSRIPVAVSIAPNPSHLEVRDSHAVQSFLLPHLQPDSLCAVCLC